MRDGDCCCVERDCCCDRRDNDGWIWIIIAIIVICCLSGDGFGGLFGGGRNDCCY